MKNLLRSLAFALVAVAASSVAMAVDVGGTDYVQGYGGWYRKDDRSGPYTISSSGVETLIGASAGGGGGGGGATGSVTPAGTNGLAAQAVQGINGGVPIPVTGSFASSAIAGSQEQDVRASSTLNAATANAAVTLSLNGQATVGFAFSGLTASGATLTYEQSNDGGTTWTGVNEVNAGTGVPAGTRSTDGQTRVAVQGRTNLRVRVSTAGTGTVTVATNISVREGLVTIASPVPPGSNPMGFAGSGQYRATLPTLADLAYGYAALDQSSRLLIAPTSSILANLQVAGSANAVGNPIFAQITSGTVSATQSGTWTVGLSGTLPAFASTPTFNVGTTNGIALDASVQQVKTTLGSPFQAGGSIGNTSFGIAGTLPAFAAIPAFKTDLTTPGTTNKVSLGSDVVTTNVNNFPATPTPQTAGSAATGTGQRVMGNDGSAMRDIRTTTTGALEPPTAASGKITKTSTAIAASTSTTIAAANTNRIALGIQCASGGVSVDETGAALTAAGVGNGSLFIPAGTGPYFTPPIATLTALTAYTATAQTCVVTEYLR